MGMYFHIETYFCMGIVQSKLVKLNTHNAQQMCLHYEKFTLTEPNNTDCRPTGKNHQFTLIDCLH